MINIIISVAIGLAVFLVLSFINIWLAIIGGISAILASMFFLGKKIMDELNIIMNTANQELQAGRIDSAIKMLNSGYKLSKRHPFVEAQLNSQIGVIYYVRKDFDKAFDYLKKSFMKHWLAQGMLAVIYMRRYDQKMMIETFEKATRANSKEGFIWNLYAYCLSKLGKNEEAIKVLVTAQKKNPADDKIINNLNALRNNDKVKMKNYGDIWYQFHLEKIPMKEREKIVATRRGSKFF